jgi:DNA-binding XRE family transcriptional regulator
VADTPLRRARLEAGLSQEALARAAGVSHQTVYRAESGGAIRKNVSEESWRRFARVLNKDTNEIRLPKQRREDA